MMFSLDQYSIHFGLPVVNRELHGKEVVPYVSVPTEAVVHATNLECFKAGLRDALWKRPADNDSERLDDDGNLHELVCRFPTAKPMPFEDRFPGYDLVVLKSELFDDQCEWPKIELTNISVQAENGGTARVRFKMLIRGNDAIDWWPRMMFRAAQITLTPPKADPLPSGHPDTPKDDDDPLSGSLEFGRDAQREADDTDGDAGETGDDTDVASANGSTDPLPDGVTQRTVEGLAEADRDIADKRTRRTGNPPKSKRTSKSGTALTH